MGALENHYRECFPTKHYQTAFAEKAMVAIHTDATSVGSWEYFRIVKCVDLGTDTEYTILSPNDQALLVLSFHPASASAGVRLR